MSSLSPRGSLSGASATAVIEDFADSLKDLTQNNKYEISNLTIIAKESTEHAQAISKALEAHIKKAGPSQKLPALYLLDSIVKNVGTPYTVYLGRSLYSTFMEAYTMVDGSTRKSMEGMLKTWKDPVPGSIDTRSVFPPEVVRPIENALIRARTAALQHRPAAQAGYQNTPTPPQPNGQFALPGHGQYQQHPHFYGQQPTPQQFQPTPVPSQAQPYGHPPQAGFIDVESIKRDLVGIIAQTQREFGSDPMSQKTQAKLQALLNLQHVLTTQQLSQQNLQAVAAQVSQLSASATPMPQLRPTPPVVSTPQWQPPVPVAQPPQMPATPYLPPPSAQPPSFAQPPPPMPGQMPALNPQQLGSLAALLQSTQKPSTPQIRAAAPALENVPHAQVHNLQTQTAAAPSPQSGADLFAALAKAGLVKPPPMGAAPIAPPPVAPVAPPSAAAAPPTDLATLLNSLHTRTTSQTGTPANPGLAGSILGKPHILPTAASLKSFRPELLRTLYAGQSNQCVQCGRRFLSSPAGREAKARHLDWHFRINARLAETSRASDHRQWFPDAVTWMGTEDLDASTISAADAARIEKPRGPEELYVVAPPGTTKTTCPICYEEMRSSHPEEVQDWVFMNAQWNGGRIVHATCLAEMTGSIPRQVPSGGGSLAAALAGLGGSKKEGSRTPDSVLGKRKAIEVGGSAGKMRREF